MVKHTCCELKLLSILRLNEQKINMKSNLRITNQIFLEEIISIKNVIRCIFIEIVVYKSTFDRFNFDKLLEFEFVNSI